MPAHVISHGEDDVGLLGGGGDTKQTGCRGEENRDLSQFELSLYRGSLSSSQTTQELPHLPPQHFRPAAWIEEVTIVEADQSVIVSNETYMVSHVDGSRLIRDVELLENVLDVIRDRFMTDIELFGNFLPGKTLTDEQEDLRLPLR